MNVLRTIRLTYQKLTRGFADSDTWDLRYHITRFALPRLKRYRELIVDPNCIAGNPGRITHEEWIQILDKMIYSLEVIDEEFKENVEFKDFDPDKFREGMELFGKWFNDLWW